MRRGKGGSSKRSRCWWYEKGVRLYYGDPDCIVCVLDWCGRPGRRWMFVPLHPPAGVDHWGAMEGWAQMLLKKELAPKAAENGGAALTDPMFAKKYPTLWLYMTQLKWDDESLRLPSGLTVFVQDGLFKGLLKENNESLCLWVAAPSFFGVLEALEMALNVPQPDWRVDRKAGGGVARKPKK